MSALVNILQGKTYEQSMEFFEKNNIKTKDNGDIYVVYPRDNTKNQEDFVKQCNYAFVDKKTNKIVHYFTQIDEIYENSQEVLDYAKKCETYKIMLRFEGTLIKVYYHNDEWKIGTNKVPNAAMAFWNSDKSFKELFYECVVSDHGLNMDGERIPDDKAYDNFLASLDKGFCYSYVIQHPENNLCIKTKDFILHEINRVDLETMEEILNKDICIDEPLVDLFSKSTNVTSNYVLYLYDQEKLSRIMLDSEEFTELKEIYGNCKSITMRYIECLDSEFMRMNIRKKYPKYLDDYDDIDLSLSINLYDMYLTYHRMYVKKERVDLKGIHKDILYKIHGVYLKTKKDIELDDIKKVLVSNYKPDVLSKILNVGR